MIQSDTDNTGRHTQSSVHLVYPGEEWEYSTFWPNPLVPPFSASDG